MQTNGQLFTIIYISPLSFQNSHFLKVFPSISIYIPCSDSWNLTTQCLTVTGDGSVGECGRLSQCNYTTYLYTLYIWYHIWLFLFNTYIYNICFIVHTHYAVVTCQVKLFQNYFTLIGSPPEIILLQHVETCLKLFQNYFTLIGSPPEIILLQHVETCLKLFQNYFGGLLQLMNIFQHAHCRWNNFEIISELLQRLK